jgi:hypothetical protein
MDKKPLIVVSFCVVVLLVLGSLSNVVGYQSVKSTVNDSPLFQTRTQRATNQQQDFLTSQYLGMGKGSLWQFPFRDNRTQQLKKAIDIISKMDDKTFAWFTELCISNIKHSNSLIEISPTDFLQIVCQLRTKSETHNDFVKDEPPSIFYFSLCGWGPGCILQLFIAGVIAIVVVLAFMLDAYLHPTEHMACRSVMIC